MAQKRNFGIIIVEDDPYFNEVLTKYVKSLCNDENYPDINFHIRSFKSGKDCIDHLDAETDVMVLDYYLDSYDEFPYTGFDLLNQVKKECKDCKVIVVSGQHNVTVTSELFKKGIYDYVDKHYMPAKKLSLSLKKILNEKVQARN